MAKKLSRGFTLFEVMIALLIFSLGLLGMAGLLTVSVKTNHAAYLRTQAAFLAQSLADRMRANSLGLWNNKYNVALTSAAQTSGYTACAYAGGTCDFNAVAARDLVVFQDQLVAFMPASKYRVNCALNAGAATPNADALLKLPPYSGTCEIEIQWKDVSLEQASSTAAFPEDFDWVFEP